MVDLRRVEVEWTTGIGGAGLSVFYTVDPDDATANLGTFFNAVKALFPNAVSWSIPSSGDLVDVVSGAITGGWSGGTAATISATGGVATYAAGTGTWVRWNTGGIVGRRRLQGRTFLVPLIAAIYDSDGTLQPSHVTTIQNAANTLVAADKLGTWHRPPNNITGGSFAKWTAGQARDKVTSLRTRRS